MKEKTQEEMLNEIADMLGLSKEETQKMMHQTLEKCNSLPIGQREEYMNKVVESYLVTKKVEDELKKDKASGKIITKEDKFIAISNYPNIQITKELQAEIKKDRQVWDGLTNQILKQVGGECKQCGWCCKLNKAQVSDLEIARIRKYLGIGITEFLDKYIERQPGGTYFHVPCSFLDENNRCKIYPVRPDVCKTFPIGFYELTIGNCHIGKYLSDLNEEWFKVMTDKLGLIDDILKPKANDELRKATENDQRDSMYRIGMNYDESDHNCKLAVIDRNSLYLVLELIKRKKVKPLNQYSLKELRDFVKE